MEETSIDEDPPDPLIHPLTRQKRDGSILKRDRKIDTQIVGALVLEPAVLCERALNTSNVTPGYLQEEALVYLIREFHRVGSNDIVDCLTKVLIERCKIIIRGWLGSLDKAEFEDAYRDVISQLIVSILDLESTRGDYLQVRFWYALKRRTIDLYNHYTKAINFDKAVLSLSELPGEDSREDVGESPDTFPSTSVMVDTSRQIERTIIGSDGLNAIADPNHRDAFILYHKYGLQIESNDPKMPTLSKHFGKTPRTIRNWLAETEENLNKWRERENHG